MEWKNIFGTWRRVFANWKYLTVVLILVLTFYSANVVISNWRSLISFYSTLGFFQTIKFFFTLFFGFKETIRFHSFVSLIIISIFLGMLFSLVWYKVNIGKRGGGRRIGLLGGLGLFFAAFAPGCAACGIGLVSVLGIGAGALSFLPYEGLELSIASIGILGFAIVKITNEMYVCKIVKSERFKNRIFYYVG